METHFKDLAAGKHSSIKFQRSYNKYGRSVFVCEIIEELPYDKSLIIERENFWIKELNSKLNGYNIADAAFGDVLTTHPNRLEIIDKISKTLKENNSKLTKEQRQEKWGRLGCLNGMYGKIHSIQTKEKCSLVNRGNSHRLGKKLTDEAARTRLSEIAKQRTGPKNSFFGKHHSDETKLKLSKANKGRPSPLAMHIIVDGIEYCNRTIAAEVTGIKASTLWYRCNSKNKKYIDTYFKDSPK